MKKTALCALATFVLLAGLLAPSAEAGNSVGECLRVQRTSSTTGIFHNSCNVQAFVIWRDEGRCRSRKNDWFPCSHWIPPRGKSGALFTGRIRYLACDNGYPREIGNGRAVCE